MLHTNEKPWDSKALIVAVSDMIACNFINLKLLYEIITLSCYLITFIVIKYCEKLKNSDGSPII